MDGREESWLIVGDYPRKRSRKTSGYASEGQHVYVVAVKSMVNIEDGSFGRKEMLKRNSWR